MKYHIDFDNDKRISFQILDNPVAHAWAYNLKSVLEGNDLNQEVPRAVFSTIGNSENDQFRIVKEYYNNLKELNVIEDLFDLESTLDDFTDKDLSKLSKDVYQLFLKVNQHNFYYNKDEQIQSKLINYTTNLKKFTDQMLDCKYNKDESYAQIKVESSVRAVTPISNKLRKTYWVENARPKVVIRAYPEFELKNLYLAKQRNDSTLYSRGYDDYAQLINVDHRICFYNKSLNDDEAVSYMKQERENILNFILEHDIDAVLDDTQYYFVNPVVAHLISDEKTIQEYHLMISTRTIQKVNITIEE